MKIEIGFETAQEAAVRWGVSPRAVQKWAAAGKIPGAEKIGRAWFIPSAVTLEMVKAGGGQMLGGQLTEAPAEVGESLQREPLSASEKGSVSEKTEEETSVQQVASQANGIPDVYQITPFRLAMPLLNSAYPVGHCLEYIQSISDENDRKVALGEYYYFSGQTELASQILEEFLDSHDPALRYSASLICTFANLSRGHIHLAQFAMGRLQEQLKAGLRSDAPPKFHAMGIFTATAASVLLHLPVPEIPPLENFLKYLPDGLRLYACYILAHQAYLEKNYERSLAIADMGLAVSEDHYPIAAIYVHIVKAMDLMSLMRTIEAKEQIRIAWSLAKEDQILEPFGEHHGLLQGLIELTFKKEYPEIYNRIIDITYKFSAGWRRIHNPTAQRNVADNLTTMEFTIAMLYNRGWLVKEIASHMEISERMVKKHIGIIYEKLCINSRKELNQYMLQ